MAGKRVLLADDDDVTRRLLARVLRALGHDVVESADGGRLLVAITACYKGEHSPDEVDLFVTDVSMPVCSGIDLLKGLRAAGWRTPVIVVTGQDSAYVRDSVARYGARLMPKPIDLDAFERAVEELLSGR